MIHKHVSIAETSFKLNNIILRKLAEPDKAYKEIIAFIKNFSFQYNQNSKFSYITTPKLIAGIAIYEKTATSLSSLYHSVYEEFCGLKSGLLPSLLYMEEGRICYDTERKEGNLFRKKRILTSRYTKKGGNVITEKPIALVDIALQDTTFVSVRFDHNWVDDTLRGRITFFQYKIEDDTIPYEIELERFNDAYYGG